jgi:lipopolysaccharide/colanic/teichoic acid biosynthesis glycosyltransferase
VRRRGKDMRERATAAVLLVPAAPVLLLAAVAIKLEGLLDRRARGPVLLREDRIARGEVFPLLKLRTYRMEAIAGLGPGPTHVNTLGPDAMTRSGAVIKQWYLDELPQLLNILRGDMGLIGTRPYPVELYERELAQGITRKRDMPAGLIGPVQSLKGRLENGPEVDAAYFEAYKTWSAWRLLLEDVRIVIRSIRVLLEHKGL